MPLLTVKHDGQDLETEAISLGECHKGLETFLYVAPDGRVNVYRKKLDTDDEDAN